ncbi:MAG: monovalent cation/H(+) antiporter subunit G [Eubacteriaceae bacterium]|nr:monovalent cation/H(+) antiporter subunit G [Eubacteriaceae bacterium]
MTEWIKFIFVAAFIFIGTFAYTSAVIGVNRFSFILNSLHCAGVGDTLGMMGIVFASAVYVFDFMAAIKMLTVLVIMWFTCPVASHLLSEITLKTASGEVDENIEGKEDIHEHI